MSELQVLTEQLADLLSDSIEDSDDALEVCQVAGMIARLSSSEAVLAKAAVWRDGSGAELVEDGWCYFDLVEMTDTLESLLRGELDAHATEELVYDVDEWVAAAVWCGEQDVVRPLTNALATGVRSAPQYFRGLAKMGIRMARSPAVAADPDVYDFWLAVADAHGE